MIRIEHIGIAVENLKNSIELYEQLLNTPCYKTEAVESEHVETAFFKVSCDCAEIKATGMLSLSYDDIRNHKKFPCFAESFANSWVFLFAICNWLFSILLIVFWWE